jgi:hypothetical protein
MLPSLYSDSLNFVMSQPKSFSACSRVIPSLSARCSSPSSSFPKMPREPKSPLLKRQPSSSANEITSIGRSGWMPFSVKVVTTSIAQILRRRHRIFRRKVANRGVNPSSKHGRFGFLPSSLSDKVSEIIDAGFHSSRFLHPRSGDFESLFF